MTAAQMAARLDVSQPRIVEMEKAEQRGAITLDTLDRAAQALGCRLVYALVPQITLENIVQDQAHKVASDILVRTDHSMKLENQGVSAEELDNELERLAKELMQKPRRLWDRL